MQIFEIRRRSFPIETGDGGRKQSEQFRVALRGLGIQKDLKGVVRRIIRGGLFRGVRHGCRRAFRGAYRRGGVAVYVRRKGRFKRKVLILYPAVLLFADRGEIFPFAQFLSVFRRSAVVPRADRFHEKIRQILRGTGFLIAEFDIPQRNPFAPQFVEHHRHRAGGEHRERRHEYERRRGGEHYLGMEGIPF